MALKTLGLRVGIQSPRLASALGAQVFDKRTTGRKLQRERARYRADNPLCWMCEQEGRVEVWTELDHVQALSNGGKDSGPKQGLCHAHHLIKTAQDVRRGKI